MNVRSWILPADASGLDRATLRLMKAWHGGLRDGVRTFWIVAATLAAATAGIGLAWPRSGLIEAAAGVAVVVAFPAGWLAHRRRFPVRVPLRAGPAIVGGLLGVFASVLLRLPIAVLLLVLDYGAPAPWRGLVRMAVAGLLAGVGWWAAQRRYRSLTA